MDSNYPGIEQALEQADKILVLEDKYTQAMQFIDDNDVATALVVLESISSIDPYYKDVSLRIDEINNQFFNDCFKVYCINFFFKGNADIDGGN